VIYINNNYRADDFHSHKISFDKDFTEIPTLKNIIQCEIYDILVFDDHVTILSKIDLTKQFDQREVDEDMLKLLKSSKFIQLDHERIACLP
jgi:hypothetical protein